MDRSGSCVLAGGVGAAKFLAGLLGVVASDSVTAIVNVGDDDEICGLRVSPDIDTVIYTCAGAIDAGRGWGLADETWQAMTALEHFAKSGGRSDIGWFGLGDRDLGTHLYRTARLASGATLSEVTTELRLAWGLACTIVPVTDDRLATTVVTAGGTTLSFQEYFVRERHDVAVRSVEITGADTARPAPGVVEAIRSAAQVVIAPSNPIVSIGPVLEVTGVRHAVAAARERCVAVSPIIGGRALKGPADRMLRELGHESSVVGVARLYRDVASTLVIDEVDAELAADVEAAGMHALVTPTVMSDVGAAAALARACLGVRR